MHRNTGGGISWRPVRLSSEMSALRNSFCAARQAAELRVAVEEAPSPSHRCLNARQLLGNNKTMIEKMSKAVEGAFCELRARLNLKQQHNSLACLRGELVQGAPEGECIASGPTAARRLG